MKLRIGLRIGKTAIAVFLCLTLYVVLKTIEYIPGVPENFAFNWYNPFFAGIAAAYSIHPSKKASFRQAKNRIVASLIGGIMGILLVSIYTVFGGEWPNVYAVNLESFNFLLPYILVSICVVLVIETGVILNQRDAVFVSVLTFLSVTINPNSAVEKWFFQFGVNRILSTILGVLIALGVNMFRLPRLYKNKNLLFCVGIDGMLNGDNDRFKGYINYKMNDLYSKGANLTLFTTRTPTTFMPLLDDIHVNRPIICMSGAALYDTNALKYIASEKIDKDTATKVYNLLKENHISPFVNTIENDVLFVYNETIDNEGERLYANAKKNAAYGSFVLGKPNMENVVYFIIVEEKQKEQHILDVLNNSEFKDEITTLVYDSFDSNDLEKHFTYIKVYNKKILDLEILKKYANEENLDIVGLTSSSYSNQLLKNSDYAITLINNKEETKQLCGDIVNSKNPDDLFKEVNRLYHSYNMRKKD